MVSGKPGEHWLTDLKDWNMPAFGSPVDGLIVSILDLDGEGVLKQSPWNEICGQSGAVGTSTTRRSARSSCRSHSLRDRLKMESDSRMLPQ